MSIAMNEKAAGGNQAADLNEKTENCSANCTESSHFQKDLSQEDVRKNEELPKHNAFLVEPARGARDGLFELWHRGDLSFCFCRYSRTIPHKGIICPAGGQMQLEKFLKEKNIIVSLIPIYDGYRDKSKAEQKAEDVWGKIDVLESKFYKEEAQIHVCKARIEAEIARLGLEESDPRIAELTMSVNSREEQNQKLRQEIDQYRNSVGIIEESISEQNAPRKTSLFIPEELAQALADNECGDAALFKKLYGQDFLYDPDEGAFYMWNGLSWNTDKHKIRHQKLEIIANQYAKEADRLLPLLEEKDVVGMELIKSFRTRARGLKTTRRMESVLTMTTAGSIGSGGLTFPGPWDDCMGYLPCANGLIELQTGRLIDPRREHFIRKHSLIKYDEKAKCPLFNEFLFSIMNNNTQLVEFLRRLIGYAAAGIPKEHIFVIFYGAYGRNGKGVFLRTIMKVLGYLAREFSAELLLVQKNPPSSSTPRPDLVHLQRTRIATFSEINEGRVIDGAVLKNLSGGDMISARALFSNEIRNFPPTHTLFLQSNYKPKAPAGDTALWSRAVLVPFDVTFVTHPVLPHERKIDVELERKLENELPGILRWVIEGAMEYHSYGLLIPTEVRSAVNQYRDENDGIGAFLIEKCVRDASFSTKKSVFTKAVQAYCTERELIRPSNQEIGRYLKKEGFIGKHMERGDFWIGVSISPEEEVFND